MADTPYFFKFPKPGEKQLIEKINSPEDYLNYSPIDLENLLANKNETEVPEYLEKPSIDQSKSSSLFADISKKYEDLARANRISDLEPQRSIASTGVEKSPEQIKVDKILTQQAAPSQDEGLAKAMQARDTSNLLTGLIKAGTQIAGKGKADLSGIEAIEKNANKPIEDYKLQKAAQLEADLEDPTKPTSVLARKMLKQAGLNVPDNVSAGALKRAGIDVDSFLNRHEASKLREAMLKQKGTKDNLTPAQKSADMKFGKSYEDFIQGAETKARAGIDALKSIRDRLNKGENLTGFIHGNMPDWLRTIVGSDSLAAQQVVDKTTVESLRQILGPQFTEQEGEKIKAMSYDPRLPEEENVKKLDRTINELEQRLNDKVNLVNHYEQYGTISNFKNSKAPMTFEKKENTLKDNEVRRMTKDGKTAIFDSNTKQFLRYE